MKFERERAPPPAEKTQTRVSILDIVVYFFLLGKIYYYILEELNNTSCKTLV